MVRLRYGNTNTYFVRGTNDGLLVDTDYAGTLPLFYKALKKNALSMEEITYLLATHYHPDHIGLAGTLAKMGIKLLILDTQLSHVHFADDIFKRERHLSYEPIDEKDAVCITCVQSRAFLAKLGIAGEIIATPSHSRDSISLVLDNGECIVGDLEPIEYLEAYAENAALQNDWELILRHKPRIVHYAHANEKYFA